MTHLVGRHLEEMADIRSTRKRKIVLICSIASCCLFFIYSVLYFTANNYWFGTFDLIWAGIALANSIYVLRKKQPAYADLILSSILLIQGVVLFLYSQTGSDHLLWLYPILAAVIFINEFRIGLMLSSSFFVLISSITVLSGVIEIPTTYAASRFLFSLLAMCVICHTSAYYYAKIISYIQSLYQEGIEDLAYMDQLTGLANRWSFENWAKQKLTKIEANKGITALIFIDIDDFKVINDNYGHDVGDRVLQHFAKRLKNNIRTKDRKTDNQDYSIARYAGDEFIILLYDVRSEQDLNQILHRICHLFDHDYNGHERINSLTVSVGAAIFPQDAKDLPELTRCADKAMYAAKHSGKNRFSFYQNCIPDSLDIADNHEKNYHSLPVSQISETHNVVSMKKR
ncbi:GGDEF domain-containing protein [Vibrio cortegadensis]|uniref:GGDEF domain-containing protein n=1 Tax=Vibrio cortegadensis TaxID=1328770 RepID=UPI00352F4C92